MIVRGEVAVERQAPAFFDATLRVQLLDVSEQDAPSEVLAETRQAISHRVGSAERFPFQLELEPPDPVGRYELAAHVDLSGNGDVEPGDLVTTASHPVAGDDPRPGVVLPVREVG